MLNACAQHTDRVDIAPRLAHSKVAEVEQNAETNRVQAVAKLLHERQIHAQRKRVRLGQEACAFRAGVLDSLPEQADERFKQFPVRDRLILWPDSLPDHDLLNAEV